MGVAVAAAYATVGILWIIVSDHIASRISVTVEDLELAQRYKGIAFVVFTAACLLALVRYGYRRTDSSPDEAAPGYSDICELLLQHPRPMWLCDATSLKFLSANEAALSQYGYTRDEFLTLTLVDIQPDEPPEGTAEAPRKTGGSCPPSVVRHARKDGSCFFAEVTTHVIPFGRTRARLAIARDVTEAVETASALQKITQHMEQRIAARTESLQVANQELDAFSRTAAHDLKAPLNGIFGYAELLRMQYRHVLGTDGDRMAMQIQRSAEGMAILVDDLLRLSQVRTHELRLARVDLAVMASMIIEDLQTAQPERQVAVSIRTPMHLHADRGLLRSLMANLIGNAWKFSARECVAHIEVGCEETPEGEIHFVRDNGAGFDLNKATKLFAPFSRFHSAKEFAGTGIGLATCQRIVGRHGGSIWIDSTPGRGTTVYFSLTRSKVRLEGRGAPACPAPLIPRSSAPVCFSSNPVQDGEVSNFATSPAPPLQEAVLAWAAAVSDVEAEACRIIRGEPVDRPRVARLLAAVEKARLRCEQQAGRLQLGVKEDSPESPASASPLAQA